MTPRSPLIRRWTAAGLVWAVTLSATAWPSAPVSSVAPDLVPLAPARLMETRASAAVGTVDGAFFGEGRLAADSVTSFVVSNRGGVSSGASAVVLNVTAVAPLSRGFMTVFPCPAGSVSVADVPTASNLNFEAGQNVANSVIVRVGASGRVCVYSSASSHVVVDANGYVPSGGSPNTLGPVRLVETRASAGAGTVDGAYVGGGAVPAGTVFAFEAANRGGVHDGASAVVLNVTAVAPLSKGFMTVFPCPAGSVSVADVPTASNLNFEAGQNVANSVIVRVGASGRVCVYSSATSELIVDVGGFVPTGATPFSLTPARLVETRPTAPVGTADGSYFGNGPVATGSVNAFVVAGRGGVGDAAAVFVNLTAVQPSSPGFMTLFPCPAGSVSVADVPTASNLNFEAGQNVANSALVQVGASGRICLYSSASSHLILDVNAYVPTGSTTTTTTTTATTTVPCPTAGSGPPRPSTPVEASVVDTSVAPTTTVAPSSPPVCGTWAPLAIRNSAPVHWDPCSTITFRIDPTLSTGQVSGDAIATLWDAIAVVEMTTGLDFVFRGTYDATYTLSDDGGTPADPSDDVYLPSRPSDAAVGFTFADTSQVPAFAGTLLGFARPQWLSTGQILIGTITIDASLDPSFDPYLIWLHELGHLVGLAHVPNGTTGELMQPIYDPSLTGYGPGDLEGLWWVGAAQPCFTALVAPDAKRTGVLLTDVG